MMIVKGKNTAPPKWLRWESSDTKSDDLKKVRRQTDQRMKQQDAQKAQRDEAEKKNRSPSIGSASNRPARQGHQYQPPYRPWLGAIGIPPVLCGDSATYAAFSRRALFAT
jgi:hypothetical protein